MGEIQLFNDLVINDLMTINIISLQIENLNGTHMVPAKEGWKQRQNCLQSSDESGGALLTFPTLRCWM